MDNNNQKSILEMANGAILERADYEMAKIIENIQDINTSATKERVLTITARFKADADRQQIAVSVIAKPKLEPTNPVNTTLYLTGEGSKTQAVEMVPNIPGQQNFTGKEQAKPPVLRMIKNA